MEEAALIVDHHRVTADRVDRLGRQHLAASSAKKSALVERQADNPAGLGAVDQVTHLGDVLAAGDRDHGQTADRRSGDERSHRFLRVAITPPPRRRRRTMAPASAISTIATRTTISQTMAISCLPGVR
jgi:hypothetical protein